MNVMNVSKLETVIQIIATVKNWITLLVDLKFKLIKQKRIVYVLRNGTKYEVRSKTLDSLLVVEIYSQRRYTPRGFEIDEKDLVVDIGAHIGVFAIFASKLARKGRIYAFEPIPENFKMLQHNIEINGIENVIPINKAISDRKGQREMLLSESNPAEHSFYFGRNATRKLRVQTVSLKDVIEQNNIPQIDFLKMDCEGAEYEVLFGCPDNILKMIRKISLEYHNVDNIRNVFSLKNFLEEKGLKVKIESDNCNMLYATR